MKAVEVKNLSKKFEKKSKDLGLRASFRSIFKKQLTDFVAVDNICFQVNGGEKVAFIGPNGAGKSTTIKMLTGILHPDNGNVQVIGLTPWRERKKLAFQIGTVFGQKPQLWYHLPAMDTFYLFGKIYEIEAKKFKKRLDFLIDKFQVQDFVYQPVRKLSLGQRMRCEMIASLIHQPKILFLDEPTIGLDVVAKQQLREVLNTMNKEEGTTIFITSHDAGDLEKIAERVIVIDLGKIIFDGTVKALKEKYATYKLIDLKIVNGGNLKSKIKIPGVKILKAENYNWQFEVDVKKTSVKAVLDQLLNIYQVEDIGIFETPMEEIISNIYAQNSLKNK
jgi:ABC-2 type transport system ATP-binding protein